jgi:hypothetical protein
MKRLSLRQASRCETAKGKVCRCRCGGLLHGSARGEGAEFFETLPADDPHYAKRKRTSKKRVLKKDRPLPLFDAATAAFMADVPHEQFNDGEDDE